MDVRAMRLSCRGMSPIGPQLGPLRQSRAVSSSFAALPAPVTALPAKSTLFPSTSAVAVPPRKTSTQLAPASVLRKIPSRYVVATTTAGLAASTQIALT